MAVEPNFGCNRRIFFLELPGCISNDNHYKGSLIKLQLKGFRNWWNNY